MPKIAIIGTTTWGITIGAMLAKKGIQISLWARREEEKMALLNNADAHLPPESVEIVFPPQMKLTTSMPEALDEAKAVVLAVPSQSMRQNIRLLNGNLKKSMLIISAAKGLEIGTNKRMSQIIAEEIPPKLHSYICVLSGPNLAREVYKGMPAATVLAAEDANIARTGQRLLQSANLCVYTNSDVIGVELGGALKNIIALGAGIADGLNYGDNAKAAFITRGLTEITALGTALGANPLTFSGLAGLGDLIATCASPLSRNHYVGIELTKGRPLNEILESMNGVAEGIATTVAARSLAQTMGLEMPITEKIYRVLYHGLGPKEAAAELMGGVTTHELAGRKWNLFSLFRRKRTTPAG